MGFKKGDRVKYVGRTSRRLEGKLGTVQWVGEGGDSVSVEWDGDGGAGADYVYVFAANVVRLDSDVSDVGVKHDTGKLRWDLVPSEAMDPIIRVLMAGAVKYGDDNWRKVPGWRRRYFAACCRHLFAWWRSRSRGGAGIDDGLGGTGESHLACAGACIMFLLAREGEPDGDRG